MRIEYSGGDFGFFDGLQLLFIGLKLSGIIDWSWYLVLSPIIIYLCLLIIIKAID